MWRLIATRLVEDGADNIRAVWVPAVTRCAPSAAACALGCSGRGRCTASGACRCHPAWSGAGCESPRCPRACSGAGTCLPSGVCACAPGLVGEDCSTTRFNHTLPALLDRVGSPFSSNAKFAENLDLVMSYKSVHKYGFMLCNTAACKASWDFSMTTIFSSLARDDVRASYTDCAVVTSSRRMLIRQPPPPPGGAGAGTPSGGAPPLRRRSSTGEEIDRHQMIIRLDNAPTKGFESFVGRRTTHRLVTAEYARHVHGMLRTVTQISNATRTLVTANGWWDAGTSPADRLVYLMAIKMTTMNKGEWRAIDRSMLAPFRDIFPGPRRFVLSPVFMSRAHASWERLKVAMKELGLGCYKRKASSTHVPSVLLATLYALQMCKRVSVYGAGVDPEEAQLPLPPALRQAAYRERDTDCCYFAHSPPYRSDAPLCNFLANRVALQLLVMSKRVSIK